MCLLAACAPHPQRLVPVAAASTAPALPALSPEDDTRDPDQADLALVLTAVATGDRTAFDELYRETAHRISRTVLRIVRCEDQTREVVQEVYLQVWSQAAHFDLSKGEVMAWLTTLARRRAIDRVRRVQVARANDHTFGVRGQVREVDHVWEEVDARLDAHHVQAALTRLSPLRREALVLTYLHGLTPSEVARHLGVPVSTLKSRIREALLCLRRTMDLHELRTGT